MTVNEPAVDQYQQMVETVPDAVYTLDADLCFTSVNEGMVSLSGYSRAELLGAHVSLVLGDTVVENAKERREYLIEHPDDVLTTQYDLYTRSGETVPIEVRFRPLDFDDEYRGTAGVMRDISGRLDRQRELQRQRDELDELDRINGVIRDVDQALVRAESREDVEQAVCDRLAASDPYVFAWIGEFSQDHALLTPRAWAGVEATYFDDTVENDDASPLEGGLGASALQTQTVQTIQRLQDDAAFDEWAAVADEWGYRSLASIPLVYDDVEYGVLQVASDRSTAFDDRETEVLGELAETISYAIAALEREQRERSLTALHESTRGLLHTESADEIGHLVVETVVSELDLSGSIFYRFDETDNALVPGATSGHFANATDEYPTVRPGSTSPIWTGFVEAESSTVADLGQVGTRSDDGPMHTALIVPIGEYGALVVASSELGALDRDTQRLVDLLAATTEAAFDRLESEAELRAREEALQEQNRSLSRLDLINELIRDVDQGLVEATDREEIEAVVCDRLTKSDRFRFAWIGTHDTGQDTLEPRAWDGAHRGYLDSVSLEIEGGSTEPAVQTVSSETVTSVPNVASDLHAESWRAEALSREFQSVVSVPLTYGEHRYGVMTLYADEAGLFDESEVSVFAELGQTVANAIHAVETKAALLTDSIVELEFRLHDASWSVLSTLALETGTTIEFVAIVPAAEADRVFFTVRDGSPDAVLTALEALVTVESGRLVADDEESLFEVTISGPTIAGALAEHGGAPQRITVEEGVVHVVVELPQRADVRGFVETFQREFSDVEFLARRNRERPMRTRQEFSGELEDTLTDRQYDVLKTAYFSGYFESPRRTNGEQLAETFDVSSPTISGHIRAAQRTLLSLVFGE